MDLRFNNLHRFALILLAGSSVLGFILAHRAVTFFYGNNFYPSSFQNIKPIFWLTLLAIYLLVFFINFYLLKVFEKNLDLLFQKNAGALKLLGLYSVRNGVVLSSIIFIFGSILGIIDNSLLNVWDILFIVVFIGLFYIGTYIYFYYSVPLSRWKSEEPQIELEKLKIEYDEQRMYLRIFLWITVSFLVSQVFVVLKSSFEPYLQDPIKYHYLQPIMIINAIQICFLIITIWALVFSQVMSRMEEVKFNLMELRLNSSYISSHVVKEPPDIEEKIMD